MRRIAGHPLWLGQVAVLRDPRGLAEAGVEAVVDLALDEPPSPVARRLVSCRFPLVDGEGNPPWLLRAAVETVAALLRAGVPTLVCCGAGMSRSPAVAGAAIALAHGLPLGEGLAIVVATGPVDVSTVLWRDIEIAVARG
ncbi:dual specificity protein phosphatase family protein [Paludisphaera soli]|uniref:dual specificity protein phosphatase family protein n=1 Tax=Paludisphaera soli TaxID=2712865 RepID=UPI0013EC8385|nr:dual specificity protein phosphatase family protein [Paludisphaera soli]